jgi:hypothetical protein
MTLPFLVLFIGGLGMLARGLMTVSRSRAAWIARSVPATANVVTCAPIPKSESTGFATFTISVRYTDAQGQPRSATLPASQAFQPGEPIDVRYDAKRPTTVFLREHFAGSDLPIALIAFGGLLMLVSFAYVRGD